MSKFRFVMVLFVLALVLSVAGTALAADVGPAPVAPTLKLTVNPSMLAIYPPIMIYTAQLSYVPPVPVAQLRVEFYNYDAQGTGRVYLGSAPVDSRGQARLSKQMSRGSYVAISRVVINRQVIWSNRVAYTVP